MTKPIALRLCLGENSDSEIKRVLFLVYPDGAVKHYGGGTYAGVVQVAKEKHPAAATYTLELAADMRHVLVEAPVREVLFADCRSWGAVLDWFRERVGEPLDGSTLIDTDSHGGALGDADHFAAARLTELERQATAAAATTVRFTLQAPADLQTAEEVDRFWTSHSPLVPGTTVNLELPQHGDWRNIRHAGAYRKIRCRNYTEGQDAAGFAVTSAQYTPGIRGGYVHVRVERPGAVAAPPAEQSYRKTFWCEREGEKNELLYSFTVVCDNPTAPKPTNEETPTEPIFWTAALMTEYQVYAPFRDAAVRHAYEDLQAMGVARSRIKALTLHHIGDREVGVTEDTLFLGGGSAAEEKTDEDD